MHLEYIHFNPVRHGLAKTPKDWEHLSFHRYVREGKYTVNWGAGRDIKFDALVGGLLPLFYNKRRTRQFF